MRDGYDSFNNLVKRTDARGVLTSLCYDTLNRSPHRYTLPVLGARTHRLTTLTVDSGVETRRTFKADASAAHRPARCCGLG